MLDFGGSNSVADSFPVGKRTRASIKSAKPAVEEKKEVSAKKKHKKKPFDWEFDRITVDLTDPVKIASNVNIEEFETFDGTIGSDGHPKTKYEFVDGDVFAYKLPNADHEAISVFFGAQLEAYTNANGNRWRVLGSTTINLGAAIRHQADQCLVLRNRNAVAGMLTKQPVAVFEMGDSQGVAGVHAKVLPFGPFLGGKVVWSHHSCGNRCLDQGMACQSRGHATNGGCPLRPCGRPVSCFCNLFWHRQHRCSHS